MPIQFKINKDDFFVYTDLPDETILREDMYQAEYKQYCVDCGWYSMDEGGRFITYVIKDYDWDNPVIRIETDKFEDAKWSVNVCKEYVSNLFASKLFE